MVKQSPSEKLEHEKRMRMVENILISTKSDTKWMKVIGGAMMSLLVVIATLTFNQGTQIATLASDHNTIVNDHEDSEESHDDTH